MLNDHDIVEMSLPFSSEKGNIASNCIMGLCHSYLQFSLKFLFVSFFPHPEGQIVLLNINREIKFSMSYLKKAVD